MESEYLVQVESLMEMKRYDDAIVQTLQGLTEFPSSVELLTLLTKSHIALGHYKEADNCSKKIVHVRPDCAYGFYLCSLIKHELKHFDAELDLAKKAVRLDPNDVLYLGRLSRAQLQVGSIKKALTSANIARKIAPGNIATIVLLADIQVELENYSEAEVLYRKALSGDPENAEILNGLAMCLWELNKERQAIDILFNALKQSSDNKTLQENTFLLVKRYLDRNTLQGNRRESLKSLPEPMQLFYKNYKRRISLLERYSNYLMFAFWCVVIAIITGVISFF